MSVIDPVTPAAGGRPAWPRGESHIGIAQSTPGVPALADGSKPQRGQSEALSTPISLCVREGPGCTQVTDYSVQRAREPRDEAAAHPSWMTAE